MGRKRAVSNVPAASGLRWHNVGMEEPKGLRLLSNDLLQAALLSKATEYIKRDERKGTKEVRRRLHDIVDIGFTENEWSKFRISDLRIDQYVRGDNLRFFVTAEKRASDREQLKLSRELCEAAVNGDNRQTINMLSAKASPDARDHFENTPLILASINGHEEIARILLDSGAHIDSRNKLGDTPLSKAAIKGHEHVVRFLLSRGANHENKDSYGETPLMVAAYNDHLGVARMLLQANADINARDSEGGTALSVCAFFNHMGVAKLLLEAGANKRLKDRQGQTAVKYAETAGHKAMVRLLGY